MDYSDLEAIEVIRDDDILIARINRHGDPLNRIDGQLHSELTALFSMFRKEREARAITLLGGRSAFSAGGDFAWFPELQDRETLEHLRHDARHLIWDMLDTALPIVCAATGAARGLGASLVLLCDVIFLGESATIADPHVRVGLAPGDGGILAWPLAIGTTRAKRYLLSGDALTALEAERIGLATAVYPDAEVEDRAAAFAHKLAALPPLAVQYTKAALNHIARGTAAGAFELSAALELSTFSTEDHAEALAAIQERRAPTFRGI